METITNAASTAASTASKLIWGEQNTQGNETAGQEPVSGYQGKGTLNEPYDQGNAENPTTAAGKQDFTSNDSTFKKEHTSNPTKMENTDTFNSTENIPGRTSSNNDTTERIPNNPTNAMAGGAPRPEHETEKTGVVGNMSNSTHGSDVIPTERADNPGAAPSSAERPEQKQQGADRPRDVPTSEQESAVKEKKDDAEAALEKRDPNDHSGEPMKMHDGNEIPKTQEERRDSKAGMSGGQELGKEPKGTGEQWVKTSGFAADDGDFDATKPGAGKEADRLLEKKGIHRDDKGNMDRVPEPAAADHKEKVPLSEKIKSKLHIGSHKEK